MKKIKFIKVLVVCLLFFFAQEITGQSTSEFKKISKEAIPSKVKTAVAKIAGYKIKEVTVDIKKNNKTSQVYFITLYKGKLTQKYKVSAEGKILEMLE